MRLAVQAIIWNGLLAVFCSAAVPRAGLPLVQDIVSACSLSCLRDFISANYPTSICADTKGLGCLCTQKSLSDLTLGEAALQCVLTSCPPSKDQRLQAYGLCARVKGAIPNIHSALRPTITAVQTASITSRTRPSETSKGVGSSKNMTHDKPGMNITSTTLATSTVNPTHTTRTSYDSKIASDTSMSTPPEQTPGEAAAPSRSLSNPQIIGLSIGVVVACILGTALLLVAFLCRRRRKLLKCQKDEPFEIGGTMAEPSPRPFYLTLTRDDRIPRTPIGAYNRSTFEPLTKVPGLRLISKGRNSSPTPSEMSQDRRDREDLDDIELESPSSMRTVSRLLPDKPDLEAYGQQNSINEKLTGNRPSSSVTIFEEDNDPRRPQSLEKQTAALIKDQGSTSRISLRGQYSGSDRYFSPSIPRTNPGSSSGQHDAQCYPSSGPMYRRDDTQTTNPLAGFSRALMNGTMSSQTLRTKSNEAMISPDLRPSSSTYSSHRSRTSDDMGSHKANCLSQRSSLRHSTASSTTSFDTMASEEERVNVKLKRTPRNLSPVKETTSRSPTPPKYLRVPQPSHSQYLRAREWGPRPIYREEGRVHNGSSRQPTGSYRGVKSKPGRYPVKPSSSAYLGGTRPSNEESAGRFLRPIDPRLYPSQYSQSRRQQQGATNGNGSQGRVSLWERNMTPMMRPPKLSSPR